MFSKVVSRRAKTQFTLVFAFFIHYLTRRLHKNSTFSGQTVLLSYPAGSRRHDSKGSCPAANVSAALRGSKKNSDHRSETIRTKKSRFP